MRTPNRPAPGRARRCREQGYSVGQTGVRVHADEAVHAYLGRFFLPGGDGEPSLHLAVDGGTARSRVSARTAGAAALLDAPGAPEVYVRKVIRAWWVAGSGRIDWLGHGAAVSRGSSTLLLMGGPRRGKTTLLFDAVYREAMAGVVNDATAFRRDAIINVPSVVRVREATFGIVAEAADDRPQHSVPDSDEPGLRYFFEDKVLDRRADWTGLDRARTTIVVPRWAPTPGAVGVRRLRSADAVDQLHGELVRWPLLEEIASLAAPLGGWSLPELQARSRRGLSALAVDVDAVEYLHEGRIGPLLDAVKARS